VRILHLPTNIASQLAISVRALRGLGVEARGLARRTSPTQDDTGIETVEWSGRLNPVRRLLRGINWRLKLIRAMAWADVLHWHWGDSTWKGLDLKIAAWLRKPRVVEFWGSDLREPTLAARDNPFLASAYKRYPELLGNRSSQSTQRMFQKNGFECLIPGYELSDYLDLRVFSQYYPTRARLILSDFVPEFPEPCKTRPLVVHAPSNQAKKGTEVVLQAMEKLSKSIRFDFKLIHQMPRNRALEIFKNCDLFLDQFTFGAEGLASYEAMALGKPVICFIKPALRARYPANLPIISADPGTLVQTAASLLKDGARRHELGRQSRLYVETYHDARKVCSDLIGIYRKLYRKETSSSRRSTIPKHL
jgi:glycosyltransferase involved in cell wall biosynthesis